MKIWDWSGFFDYLTNGYIAEGAAVTLGLTAASLLGGLLLGFILYLARSSNKFYLKWIGNSYVWLFRGTPLLVQLLIIYTCLPLIGIRLSVLGAALLGLILNEASYLSETIRSGVNSVSRGQIAAARSVGMTESQVMRYVVAPQAFRIIIPPLGNSVNGTLKTTSVASVISMNELLRRTQVLTQEKFQVLELFAVAAIYYLIMTTVWDLIQRRIERRFGRGYEMNLGADHR